MYSYFGSNAGMGSQSLYSSHSHGHHSHGFPEPMVMAYPCDDGFFFAVCDPPAGPTGPTYGPAAHKSAGGCCSTDRRYSRDTETRDPSFLMYWSFVTMTCDVTNKQDQAKLLPPLSDSDATRDCARYRTAHWDTGGDRDRIGVHLSGEKRTLTS